MSSDLGIIFELQWKKKPGGNNREDVASIGIWDTPDSSLDWMTFKSYVCQNLGTTEEIYVAYVDSDGDELPIESECEFQEALKFARQRANKGREVVLKVDKRGCRTFTPPSSEQKQKEIPAANYISDVERDVKKKSSKTNGKIVSKYKSGDKVRTASSQLTLTNGAISGVEEKKSKSDDYSLSHELSKRLACMMKLETEKRKKAKADKDDSPPPWFKKYMQKFKNEIVAEVTSNVMYNTRQVLENAKMNSRSSCSSCYCERNGGSAAATKAKKKKTSDDDSSDCALSSDQRDHKLLKKIEKLHKREKKLEKKLDSKLEKLENKTKRRMEKKFQNKSSFEHPIEKKACLGSRKRLSDIPVGTYLMDAIPLNDGLKPAEIHIKLGESFTKVWEIMNNGTLPWTDKTELRLAWGTSGLEPEATILKCPILLPGEKGEIAVTFRAPEFPGTFESYWHFYHMGDRFGRWLGCAVIVDSKESEKQPSEICNISCEKVPEMINEVLDNDTTAKTDQPVDLRMKCEPEQLKDSISKSITELENTYERISEDQPCTESVKTETRQRNAEYESDSDDENLSVISGTISLTSDSEEDENFVVVPMPACFMCDVPLEKSDNVPSDRKETTKDTIPEEEAGTNAKEISNHTHPGDASPMDISYKTTEEHSSNSEVENEKQTFTTHEGTPENTYEIPQCMSTSGSVYVVDMKGCCLPANIVWANHSSETIRNSQKTDTNTNQEAGSSRGSSQSGSDSGKHENKDENKEIPKRTTFHTHTHCHTQAMGPSFASFSSSHVNGNDHTRGTSFSYQTESSPNNEYQHQEQHTFSNSPPSSQSSHTSTRSQSQDPNGTPAVHILPETLVNGAINVASQAISTARAVFSNLRARPSEQQFAEWHWNDNAADWSAQTDRSTTESLNILLEMGFTNKILNVLLLQRYDNDIAKVVAELLIYNDFPGNTNSIQTQ